MSTPPLSRHRDWTSVTQNICVRYALCDALGISYGYEESHQRRDPVVVLIGDCGVSSVALRLAPLYSAIERVAAHSGAYVVDSASKFSMAIKPGSNQLKEHPSESSSRMQRTIAIVPHGIGPREYLGSKCVRRAAVALPLARIFPKPVISPGMTTL